MYSEGEKFALGQGTQYRKVFFGFQPFLLENVRIARDLHHGPFLSYFRIGYPLRQLIIAGRLNLRIWC